MVDKYAALEVRHQWVAAGSPRCDHLKFGWEQDSGTATGNLVCLRCGALSLYEDLKHDGLAHRIRST